MHQLLICWFAGYTSAPPSPQPECVCDSNGREFRFNTHRSIHLSRSRRRRRLLMHVAFVQPTMILLCTIVQGELSQHRSGRLVTVQFRFSSLRDRRGSRFGQVKRDWRMGRVRDCDCGVMIRLGRIRPEGNVVCVSRKRIILIWTSKSSFLLR